jgi:hypothetical protein
MNRSKRIALLLYCLLVVLCCFWVPWHIVPPSDPSVRVGYGWVWSGPSTNPSFVDAESSRASSPDFPIIGLELFALTVLAVASWAATRR